MSTVCNIFRLCKDTDGIRYAFKGRQDQLRSMDEKQMSKVVRPLIGVQGKHFEKGWYKIGIKKERFYLLPIDYKERLDELIALFSSDIWHGDRDEESEGISSLVARLSSGSISVRCLKCCHVVSEILFRLGIKSRIIALRDKDNGHIVLEVESTNNEWLLYDPDLGMYYQNGFKKRLNTASLLQTKKNEITTQRLTRYEKVFPHAMMQDERVEVDELMYEPDIWLRERIGCIGCLEQKKINGVWNHSWFFCSQEEENFDKKILTKYYADVHRLELDDWIRKYYR